MFNSLLKGCLSAVAVRLLVNYQHLSIAMLRIESAKSYLQGVRLARLSALGLMRMMLVIALISGGALLLHAGVFVLLPWSVKAKALLALLLGAVYVTTGVAVLRAALAEKTWLERSGCMKMLDELTGPSGKK